MHFEGKRKCILKLIDLDWIRKFVKVIEGLWKEILKGYYR